MSEYEHKMTESTTNSPIQEKEFSEMLEFLDSGFRKYMHAREVLSTLPESTVRRHSRHLLKGPRMTRDEKTLLHDMVAAIHTYESNAVAASRSGADFASGLMASAACEALAILGLIQTKLIVKRTPVFRRRWKKYRERNGKAEKRKSFAQFLLEQRTEDLFRIAREAGLFNEDDLPELVSEVLRERGFPGRLCDFVRLARNCIHPRWMLQANEQYARMMEVSYSLEGMKSFHVDFALCAWEFHGRLSSSPQLERQEF